jgi:hypothetical protein
VAATLLTPRRLRLYPLAILIGGVVGFAVFLATSNGLRTIGGGRIGGDFAAFYGAAALVREGSSDSLYDRAAQRRVQAPFLPDAPGGWIDFAYPPYVALAYLPFTLVGFKSAYVLHTLLMAGCTIAAVRLLSSSLPGVRAHLVVVVAATLTFYPLFRAVVGGQNTALSVLCAAGAAWSLHRGRDAAAGVWIGAWLFKPHLALMVGGLLALSGRWRVLIGMAGPAAVAYALGAWMGGPEWPIWWWRDGVAPFVAADAQVDRGNGVSFAESAADLGFPAIGWIAAGLTIAGAIALTWRSKGHPAALMGVLASAAVLSAPHALFYDGGLAAIGLIAAGSLSGTSALPWVAASWLVAVAHMLRASLPLPPISVALIAALVLAAHALRRRQTFERFEGNITKAAKITMSTKKDAQ